MTQNTICPFCSLDVSRILFANDTFVVIRDGYPISPGHTLIIPKRHIASFFELSESEFTQLQTTLAWVRQNLDQQFHPDGYNLGVNDGPAAGQTVPHLHIHLVPRYTGDHADPRGGVRWIMPDKAKYWTD